MSENRKRTRSSSDESSRHKSSRNESSLNESSLRSTPFKEEELPPNEEGIIYDMSTFNKFKKYLVMATNTVVNQYDLIEEQDPDICTKANAKLQYLFEKDIKNNSEVYTEIKNSNYDISEFHDLIKDNLMIITTEHFKVESANEMAKIIKSLKDRKEQSRELKKSYDPIDNLLGF